MFEFSLSLHLQCTFLFIVAAMRYSMWFPSRNVVHIQNTQTLCDDYTDDDVPPRTKNAFCQFQTKF